jgi:hypothetical protein
MGPLRRCAVPLVLLLAVACGSPDAGPDTTLSAAGGTAGAEPAPAVTSSTPPTTVAPVTAAPPTTARAPVTTGPATTAATRPRPTTPPPPPPAPPPTVLSVDPATVLPVTTNVTQGGTTAFVKAVREQYLGEKVYVSVEATAAERIVSIQIDFGDGYVTTNPQPIPWTLMTTGAMSASAQRTHVYPAAGRYRITVTLTVVPGLATPSIPPSSPTELQWFPSGPEHPVTVTADFLQRPDPAPFQFPRVPGVTSE